MTENIYKEYYEFLGQFRYDPLGFVNSVFPWGEDVLTGHAGPDVWQEIFLRDLSVKLNNSKTDEDRIIRKAISSGHGVGKSSTVAWLILWAVSTRKNTRGVVTANTENQLTQKTWGELSKWFQLFVAKSLFSFTATSLYSADRELEKTWRIDAVPWNEAKPEAFAGLHNQGIRLLLIMDEASAVSDNIWEVAEGALSDKNTEIIWCVFGNPTKSEGRFYECFNKFKHRWDTQKVDSREVKISNKEQIQKWVDDYGEDSDFVRVRVKGEFPRQSDTLFLPIELLEIAQQRKIENKRYFQAIMGVDVARYGTDSSAIVIRQGDYVYKPKKFSGLGIMELAAQVLDAHRQVPCAAICIDATGIGGGLYDVLNARGLPVIEVTAAGKAFDFKTYANRRAELYGRTKTWMDQGGMIVSSMFDQFRINYGFNNRLQIQLESKDEIRKRNGESPDESDALTYTFAYDDFRQIALRTQARPLEIVNWT